MLGHISPIPIEDQNRSEESLCNQNNNLKSFGKHDNGKTKIVMHHILPLKYMQTVRIRKIEYYYSGHTHPTGKGIAEGPSNSPSPTTFKLDPNNMLHSLRNDTVQKGRRKS